MKKLLLFLICILLLSNFAAAQKGHAILLAVKDVNGELEGSSADLYLEIEDGNGRVFMETRPLTKLDTQISTRFARDIACNYLEANCENKNFLYVIEASGPIIGGPSAGAAIAVLSVALMSGNKIDETVAITGTINSGGLIGPVGGLKGKIDAASSAGIKKVLIPKGSRFLKEENNLTLDLFDYAKLKNIRLVEVADLTEALYEFTGKQFKEDLGELELDKEYTETMKKLAVMLCDRSKEMENELMNFKIADKSLVDEEFVKNKDEALNLTIKAEKAFDDEAYYSSASYCFGANVKFGKLLLDIGKEIKIGDVDKEIEGLDAEVEKEPIETITDLQAYMVVKERLKEAKTGLEETMKAFALNETYNEKLSYTIERLESVKSWSEFFDNKGKKFDFNRESIRDSCLNKMNEAQERIQYVELFFPDVLKSTKEELEFAKEDYQSGVYELCLFRASKAKADADAILSVLGVEEDKVIDVIDTKLRIVKNRIIEAASKGEFPILGYSYYEYAISLKEDDKFSALLYAEDALELSSLDLYFKEYKEYKIENRDYQFALLFVIGLAAGFSLGILFVRIFKRDYGIKRKNKAFRKKKMIIKPSETSRRSFRGKKR